MWHSRPPRDPPPFMAKTILNFHFDYLIPSLMTPGGQQGRTAYGDGVTAHILLSLSQVTSVQIEEHTLKFQNRKVKNLLLLLLLI